MKFIRFHFSSLFLLLVLSVFTVLPFFHSGFFPIHDDTQVGRVYEMGKALSDGQFPVRWVSDLGYGYGYPIFNFYSPLPYYIGGALTLVGFDALLATKITFIIGIVLAGLTMYSLAERFFGKQIAVIAGVLYIYFPYHAVNIYVRGALSELFAYAFLPLVFLGLLKIHYARPGDTNTFKSNIPSMLLVSISIALVVLSHNLSAFMLFLFLPIFMLISVLFSGEKAKHFVFYLVILMFAFLFSAFYSVPAVLEARFTNVGSQVGGGAFYPDHFVCPLQLWDSPWGFGGSTQGCTDGLSFRLGKLNVVLALFSLVFPFAWLKKLKEKRFILYTSVGFFLFSIFMTLGYSQTVWSYIWYIDFLQYPWRFLNFAGLFMVLLIGYFLFLLQKRFSSRVVVTCFVFVIVGTLIMNAKLFMPQKYLPTTSSFYTDKRYLNFTTSKISDEYMPTYFAKPAGAQDVKKAGIEIVIGEGTVVMAADRTNYTRWLISMKKDGEIRINKAYFPALKVFVDGHEINYRVKSDGLYTNLVHGSHTVELKFVQTPTEIAGDILTILSLVGVFLVIIRDSRFYGQRKKTS